MYVIRLFSCFICVIHISSSYAFNWKKCQRDINSYKSANGGGVFLSTTGFISSFGACSMFGKLDYDSKVFIAHNLDKLKVDFARGRGEYAMAFASIYGCTREGQLLFPSLLKSKFSEVVKKEEDLEDVHKILVNEIRTNSYMVSSCKS